jgi:hypothetical protein
MFGEIMKSFVSDEQKENLVKGSIEKALVNLKKEYNTDEIFILIMPFNGSFVLWVYVDGKKTRKMELIEVLK